jgi:hypothetical protein
MPPTTRPTRMVIDTRNSIANNNRDDEDDDNDTRWTRYLCFAVTVPTASILHDSSLSIRMIAAATGDFLAR